ncbi:MAG TPA: hypothetical protein VIA18_26295, partial [Polyangia bacterium]|nr:hypothetical protein [Polyangia bacterium]
MKTHAGLGPDTLVPRVVGAALARLQHVGAEEGFVLSRVDGHTTVGEICLLVPFDADVTVEILKALRRMGAIDVPGGEPIAPAALPPLAVSVAAPRKVTPAAGTPAPAARRSTPAAGTPASAAPVARPSTPAADTPATASRLAPTTPAAGTATSVAARPVATTPVAGTASRPVATTAAAGTETTAPPAAAAPSPLMPGLE